MSAAWRACAPPYGCGTEAAAAARRCARAGLRAPPSRGPCACCARTKSPSAAPARPAGRAPAARRARRGALVSAEAPARAACPALRALKPQIWRPLQVLPSGYTTMRGQRSSRAMAFCDSAVHRRVSSHTQRLHARRAACRKRRTIMAAALAPLLWSSRSTKIVCCDIISCAHMALRCVSSRTVQQASRAARAHAPSPQHGSTHVAHDREAHVLRRRDADGQAAPQEEPDVREALPALYDAPRQQRAAWRGARAAAAGARLVVADDDGCLAARCNLATDRDVLKAERKEVQADQVRDGGLLQAAEGCSGAA